MILIIQERHSARICYIQRTFPEPCRSEATLPRSQWSVEWFHITSLPSNFMARRLSDLLYCQTRPHSGCGALNGSWSKLDSSPNSAEHRKCNELQAPSFERQKQEIGARRPPLRLTRRNVRGLCRKASTSAQYHIEQHNCPRVRCNYSNSCRILCLSRLAWPGPLADAIKQRQAM